MRLSLILLGLAITAAPAAAQRIGARTAAPQAHLPGLAPGQDDLAAAVAAAAAHPLGSLENPVRVGGPDGERAFLARLRCADGAAPRIGARTDGGVGGFGSLTRAFALTCGTSEMRVHFDIYHQEHVETRAPAGLIQS